MATGKKRVAILGGGVGGVSAAWFLTDPDIQGNWQDHYDVTLYQMGWRLGGKGSSGRNADKHQRIEEHGLHVWMGVYRNAFRMIQKCYAKLGMSWESAFEAHDLATVYEQRNGQLTPVTIGFPRFEDENPGSDELFPDAIELLKRLLTWGNRMFLDSLGAESRVGQQYAQWLNHTSETLDVLAVFVQEQGLDKQQIDVAVLPDILRVRLYHDLEHLEILTRDMFQFVPANSVLLAVNLAFATLRGCLQEQVVASAKGFDVLDKYEIREFLQRYGAHQDAINSVVVRGIYDLTFAYPKGFHPRPGVAEGNMAAGVFIRIALRIYFGYKRAFVFKMLGGMGDVVFTPLYDVLKSRGVKFEFFHRVRELRLQGNQIGEIEFGVQATPKNRNGYDPIRTVDNRRVWPDRPKYELLDEEDVLQVGNELPEGGYNLESAWTEWLNREKTKILRLGEDEGFDIVILAIPPEGLKYICKKLVDSNEQWRRMVESVESVQTAHFQLWINLRSDELGGIGHLKSFFGGHFQSGGDFSFLIPKERTGEQGARSTYYFSSEIEHGTDAPPPFRPAPEYPRQQLQRVKDEALAFIESHMATILPGLYQKGTFRWDSLVDGGNGRDKARLDSQFFRINVDPSERYVLSVKGSIQHRIHAANSGYANLFLAGDWTRGGFNAGSVESAVSSAMQAVRGYTKEPKIVIGEDDFNRHFATDSQMATDRKPVYVDRPTDLSHEQPIVFENVQFTALIMAGNRKSLQKVLDRELNAPSDGKVLYIPAPLSRVMLGITEIGRARPGSQSPDYGKGWIRLFDAGFWLPVLRLQPGPITLLWYHPFLFVDAPWGIISGRETWGLHKTPATVNIDWNHAIRPVEIQAETVMGFDPANPQQAVPRTVLEVRKQGDRRNRENMNWKSYNEMFIQGLLPLAVGDLDAWGATRVSATGPVNIEWNLHDLMRVVSLKQIRDVADGGRSAYQAVVETSAKVENFVGGGFLTEDLLVHLFDTASHPIAQSLGLAPVNPVISTIQAKFDFEFGDGIEVWRA